MHSSKLMIVIRSGLAIGLVSLAIIGISLAPRSHAQAGLEQPGVWQDDDYPPPDETQPPIGDDYPAPGETQLPTEDYPPPGGEEETQEPEQTPVMTATAGDLETATAAADLATTTALSTIETTTSRATFTQITTPVFTTLSATQQAALVTNQDGEKGGFNIDWGFFWFGFAFPVLVGSGVVLYLLDRKPYLFRLRPKP